LSLTIDDPGHPVLREISVPREYAEAIGFVAVHWAAVEASVETGIWYLLDMLGEDAEPRANTLTAEMSLINRMFVVTSLLNLEGEDYAIETWKTLVTRINDLRNRRNRVVHSQWRRTGPDVVIAKKTTSKGVLRPVIKEETVGEIRQLASEIADCYGATEGFFLAHFLTRNSNSTSGS
jgi:hypothetical protein